MNSRYELKRILLNLTALLMAVLMLFSVAACSDGKDDQNADGGLVSSGIVEDMPFMAVARVEFAKLTYNHSFASCASKVEYVFKIKDLIYSKRPSWGLYDGQTLTFDCHPNSHEWLEESGYVYEEGKEYVLMFSPEYGFDDDCYIPLHDLDKCCELIKKDSEYYGFPLDVSPDEFVANLSEVIDKLKAYYNDPESGWPYP